MERDYVTVCRVVLVEMEFVMQEKYARPIVARVMALQVQQVLHGRFAAIIFVILGKIVRQTVLQQRVEMECVRLENRRQTVRQTVRVALAGQEVAQLVVQFVAMVHVILGNHVLQIVAVAVAVAVAQPVAMGYVILVRHVMRIVDQRLFAVTAFAMKHVSPARLIVEHV